MAYPPYLRAKARSLRTERGMALDDIAERLALSRSTIYYWIRDLELPRSTWADGPSAAAHRRATRAMQAKYARIREEAYADGLDTFADLAAGCPTFRDFVALYIAEGTKRSPNSVSLCNSEPVVVLLADRWIRHFATRPVSYAVQHHADQGARDLQRDWGKMLGVAPSLIRTLPKSNSSQLATRTWRCRYGVLAVTCHETALRSMLQGWMDCLHWEWEHIDSTGIGV